MNIAREPEISAGTVAVPAVVSIAASGSRVLKHADTFGIFDEFGDVLERERSPAGLFHLDTRHLSRLRLTIEGQRPLMLGSAVQPDDVVLDVDLTNPDVFRDGVPVMAKDSFHVSRAKFLSQAACHELFGITSFAEGPARVRIEIEFSADFADLFEVRGHTRSRRGETQVSVLDASTVLYRYRALDGVVASSRIVFDPAPAVLERSRARFELDLPPRSRRSIAMVVECGRHAGRSGGAGCLASLRRARRERRAATACGARVETSDPAVNAILARSRSDLAMLSTETGHGAYPYAGVPWFAAVFGRDGLLTALQMLSFDPSIARGVLSVLAAFQARDVDPAADQEPGKIVHEVRHCELARLGEVPFGRYYGSVDSTPLFVALAGLYWSRTRDRAFIEALWPRVRAALAWMDDFGDRDGDGFIEYRRMRGTGLRNQGWKDSEDAVFHADGRLAEGAIALCEVQGYAYLARRTASMVAADLGDRQLARLLDEQATLLRARFEAEFWDEALGTYALALDGAKNPCRVRSSNAGQLLFTGIAHAERARRVAAQMLEPGFFSGWGVRTLSNREPRFNPTSYHNGSVWPHDNALIALGMAHYGFMEPTLALTSALLEAAGQMHLRRLPELFCGFRRKAGKAPVLYPVACVPQAWAAAAPFALLQACLGMEIDASANAVVMRDPRLPKSLDWIAIRGLEVGEGSIDLMIRRQHRTVAVNLLERRGRAEVQILL